jgi:hypothetical protein
MFYLVFKHKKDSDYPNYTRQLRILLTILTFGTSDQGEKEAPIQKKA